MVIIMLLVSGALVSYTGFIEKQRLVAAAEQLESGLREAQNMAKIGYLSFCDELFGIRLLTSDFNTGVGYQIQVLCADASVDHLAYVYLADDLSISKQINITFRPYDNLANGIDNVVLSSTRSSNTARFDIDQGGSIKVTYN